MLDPFKAPKAPVADFAPGRDQASRPPSITLACRLLWATIVIELLSLIPGVRNDLWSAYARAPGAIVLALSFIAVMTLLEVWLIRLVARRHGWARWALLVYLIAGWLMTFSDFSSSVEQGMAAVIVDLVTGATEMVAIAMLFLSRGRAWFDKPGDID